MSQTLDAIRDSYPQYDNIPDEELVARIGSKYPVYRIKDAQFDAEYLRVKPSSSLKAVIPGQPLTEPEKQELPPITYLPPETERALRDYQDKKKLAEQGKMREGVQERVPVRLDLDKGGIGPDIPKVGPQESAAGKVGAGALNFAIGMVNFLKSNEGLMMGVTGGGALGSGVREAMYGALAGQMVTDTPEAAKRLWAAIGKGDLQEATTEAATVLTLPYFAAKAAVHVAGQPGPVVERLVREIEGAELTPPASPDVIARNLAAPGTMRPSQIMGAVAPEAEPPDMLKVSPEALRRVTPNVFDVRYIEATKQAYPEPSKVESETRGKVSFGAEAPTLLRNAIEETKAAGAPQTAAAVAKGAEDASKIPSPESIPKPEVRPQVGETPSLRQQGETPEAGPPKEVAPPETPASKSLRETLHNQLVEKGVIENPKGIRPSINPRAGEAGSVPVPQTLVTFAEQDLKPAIKKTVDTAKGVAQFMVDTFAPVVRAERGDVDILFESKGQAEQFITRAGAALDSVRGLLGKMPQPDQIAFIDRMKTGERQPSAELQLAANVIREWDDRLFNEVAKFKPDLPYLENHMRVLWKVIPGSPEAQGTSPQAIGSKRPWQGSKGFLKQHVLETMSEGLKLGGEPVTYNPFDMFLLHAQDAMKFIAANRAWESLQKTGATVFVKTGERAPEGYSRINDSIAKVYFKTPSGEGPGEWWVHEGAARMINNYLSRDYVRTGKFAPIGKSLLALKNATTAIELGLSPFHAVFESNEIMGSSIGLGLAKMFSGKITEGAKDIVGAPASTATTFKLGSAAIEYAKSPEEFQRVYPEAYQWFTSKYPDAAKLVDDLFAGGGKVAMHEDYRVAAVNSWKKAMESGNYVGMVFRALPALNQIAMKPLFETYIPRLKVGLFLREYAFESERNAERLASGELTRPELARKTWSFVEDRFGELNWDNLFWDRTFKSGMQLLFRSVTWKLGNIRGFGKAARDSVAELGNLVRGRGFEMTLPMGWLLGMSVITGLQSTLITKFSTGKYPWELAETVGEWMKNLVFPRIDINDPSQRVSTPTYWRDAVHLAHSVPDYIRSSMTGEIGRLLDVWRNKDFYGTQVYNPDDPYIRQGWNVLQHMVPLPFGMSSYIAAQRTGESEMKSTAGFFGFTKAPFYMSHTPAELEAMETVRSKMPIGARTQEQATRSINRTKAIQAIKRGDMDLGDALAQGLIRPGDIKRVQSSVQESSLVHLVKNSQLTPDEAVRIYQKSNAAEQSEINSIVIQKITRSKTLSPEEQQRLLGLVSEANR